VAEEGWAGVSDAGEPDAAGTDAEGFGGAVGSAGADPTHPHPSEQVRWGPRFAMRPR
jgi:hypothetical protein